jgi:L-lysine 6-transaminase
MAELAEIAANKPANPDMYTTAVRRFVETFVRWLGDPALPHSVLHRGRRARRSRTL